MAKNVKMQKRENNVKRVLKDFCKIFPVFTMCCAGVMAHAEQAPNPRSATAMNSVGAVGRTAGAVVRGNGDKTQVVSGATRSAVLRPGAIVARSGQTSKKRVARNATNGRVMVPRNAASVSRSALPASRTMGARSATNVADGMARAASRARATAVFKDVSKIGGGYLECRDAYATCMDQFCANANDTYRRCYCSSRYSELRDKEKALDEATAMLQGFESGYLDAVDKTAAEVEAMYSATVGEKAVKEDVSAAGALLSEIDLLLAGETSGGDDLFGDTEDLWSDASKADSMFDEGSREVNLTELEGTQLYNAVNSQCVEIVANACSTPAVLAMATSAYNIMITQDCNIYEKKVNAKNETVKNGTRVAEKALREARLEEYRAHNSQDVNECLTKVHKAMSSDLVCGVSYSRCLDAGTGVYINQLTGEPILTPRFFQLKDMITLKGVDSASWTREDVLKQNKQFDEFLDSKKIHAAQALDTCRDLADEVWAEFKRNALIEIAQAQDAKIEEVKMSCVNTVAECYDTQSNSLKDFDKTTSKVAGALSVYAAREMCADKVNACASLYGGTEDCKFDNNGRLETGNASNQTRCGLTALLDFVDAVDMTRVAESCQDAIDSYVKDLCTPKNGDHEYPWNCRTYEFTTELNGFGINSATGTDLGKLLARFAIDNCFDPTVSVDQRSSYSNLPSRTQAAVQKKIEDVKEDLDLMLNMECEGLNGYWAKAGTRSFERTDGKKLLAFYNNVYGGNDGGTDFGICYENTTRTRCLAYNTDSAKEEDSEVQQMATYNAQLDTCEFTLEWYQQQCSMLGEGFFENGVCYIKQNFKEPGQEE